MTALQGTSNIVVAEAAATKDEISVLRSLGPRMPKVTEAKFWPSLMAKSYRSTK
jgi:hypothetical protein